MPSETADTVDLYHSVLSGGDPVLAAGEAQIVRSEGRYYGRYITYHSGHFQPGEEVLISASTPSGTQESNSMRLDHIERFS
jgi:hypothetical protein